MFKIALYEPRIPQNTGNIGRTCLAYNSSLDLICPLGFSLENKYLKRAGLDYWKYLDVSIHDNFECYMKNRKSSRIIGMLASSLGIVPINSDLTSAELLSQLRRDKDDLSNVFIDNK